MIHIVKLRERKKMYQHLTLEQIKSFLKHTRQDILVTKINRNIVASEFHLIGIIEILKTIKSTDLNSLILSSTEYFWLNNPNVDVLMFASMLALGLTWYYYQNELTDLYETINELNLEKDKKVFIK